MIFTEYFSGYITSGNTISISIDWSGRIQLQEPSEIRSRFFRYLNFILPPNLEPNVLSIMARAINSLRIGGKIMFLPCWSSRRWKSLT